MLKHWLLCMCASLCVLADDVALVRVGEPWRVFDGVVEPSTGTNAWFLPGFNDSVWPLGISGFSYAYGYEATSFPTTPGQSLSRYFRKRFLLSDPAAVRWLTLRIDYNAGFVAYLNGQEVARRNLPGPLGARVPFNTPATNWHSFAQPENIDITAFRSLLVPGTNALAIQTHNTSLEEIGFVLVPELLANFTRGPLLESLSSNSVKVVWHTPAPATSRVEFGVSPALGSSMAATNLVETHLVTLTNLAPDTTYYYRVASAAGGGTAVSPIETFRTFKTEGSFSFAVLGDSGSGSLAQHAIASVIRKAKPDLVLHVGDIIYPAFTHELTDTRCLSVYGPHMRNVPYFFILGNHDLHFGPMPFLDGFSHPTNNVSLDQHAAAGTSPEHYFSFDHGDAHFTGLFAPFITQHHIRAGDPQHRWLEADLAASKKPWKFIWCHHPLKTSSLHRYDDFNSNGIADTREVMDAILPLARKYGVQMIFAGHDHVYERFTPTNSVNLIITGGGGGSLYPLLELDAGSAQFWSRHNAVKVSVQRDRLLLEALDAAGAVFDTMTFHRAVPREAAYQAAWHAPNVELEAADDGDGNLMGQRFDLIGEPIPTFAGESSNLGQLYVNNDGTHLHIGLEQVMLYPGHDLLLFIESPRLAGITNLLQVGNGKIDGEGEGADGFDLLENLSFTNFTPSIGCILGDEFADGQHRSFRRSNLPGNLGQGVFYLNRALDDVADVRVQQFNRSPQHGGIAGEQNADLIELSIPYSALGGLKEGDTIRLGAVAVSGTVLTNANRLVRAIDSSFLGAALHGSGTGPVALEGLKVHLVSDPDPDADELSSEEESRLGTDPKNPDTDQDGLPDGWEVRYQFDPRSALSEDGGSADPDKDGASNLAEYLAGTHPRDARSVLRVRLDVVGKNRLRITWPAVAGKKYRVQESRDPFAAFQDLISPNFPLRATAPTHHFDLEAAAAPSTSRYYRVVVTP